MSVSICSQCEEQKSKTRNGKPHDLLQKMDELRVYTGKKPLGYEEQDFVCLKCRAKFTQSSNKNDLPWTLWQG